MARLADILLKDNAKIIRYTMETASASCGCGWEGTQFNNTESDNDPIELAKQELAEHQKEPINNDGLTE